MQMRKASKQDPGDPSSILGGGIYILKKKDLNANLSLINE